MGHDLCADHCPCLRNDFVFDPMRCPICCSFIKSKFQGAQDPEVLLSASAELERHMLKLRKFCSGQEPRIAMKVSNFVVSIRSAARKDRIDLDFFRDLSVRETDPGDKYSDAVSEAPSAQAQGPSTSRPSKKGKRSGKYRVSDKPGEDLERIQTQMASMQEAIERLSKLPALFASMKDSNQSEPGRQSEGDEGGQGSDTRQRQRPQELERSYHDSEMHSMTVSNEVGLSGQEERSASRERTRSVPGSLAGSGTESVGRSDSRHSSGIISDTRPRSESREETGNVSGMDSGSGHRSLHGQGTDGEVIPLPDG